MSEDLFTSVNSKWDEIKEYLRREHNILEVSYETWIMPLQLYSVDNDVVVIMIPSDQSQYLNYISNKYMLPFKVAVSAVMQHKFNIQFILMTDTITENKKVKNNVNLEEANLNSKYTFDTFVVGSNNRFAHSAALATAESPGDVYNPLFLYGGVGLGKTHLMHSIAHFILEADPEKKVLYVTSEEFTNEVIEAIRTGNSNPSALPNLREKYRNVDVLLVDDIQFIIGKESTQEEFFHTFNVLHTAKKQIILSSDKPPKDIEILEERLRSRFEWGLVADIQPPDYETRIAILRKKDEQEGYHINDEIFSYIANNIKSNIRELEGAYNKLIAFSNLNKTRAVDLGMAEEALKDVIHPNSPKQITPEYIMEIVCDHFHVSPNDIASTKRNSEIVLPRQIVMYLCRELTSASLSSIAKMLHKRDHTTIISGYNKIIEEKKTNDSLNNNIEIIKKKINPV